MIGKSEELEVGADIFKSNKGQKRSWLIKWLAKIIANNLMQMKQHTCKFEDTSAVASFNAKLIKH